MKYLHEHVSDKIKQYCNDRKGLDLGVTPKSADIGYGQVSGMKSVGACSLISGGCVNHITSTDSVGLGHRT
jgi:hypothetical protein